MNIFDEINEIKHFCNDFTHLHVHTTYSFLDGANKISDYIDRLKELGMTTAAITDHNHIGGWLDFKEACEANNIKPIFGCEMYQTWDTEILSKSADDRREYAIERYKEATGEDIPEKINGKKATKKQLDELLQPYMYDTKQYHLIVLAMNQTGINNLIKLQSEAADKCTYNGRFCCDFKMLEKYNEGLIILSACLGGMIPNKIYKGKVEEAWALAKEYKRIFGDRFYLEIQPLNVEEQKIANIEMVKMSNELDIKLVATNDVHYTYKEDNEDHDTLLCVGLGKYKNDTDRMRYEHEFWVRSYDEMEEAFERHTGLTKQVVYNALAMTNEIASRIESVTLGSDKPLFPEVYVPKGLTAEQYLVLKTYKGLYKYKNEHPEIDVIKYEKRLYEELDIINSKGFAPYILKIIENIEYCEANDIPVGPGRGSAAGALTLFVTGCTKVVDPIKYDLLFFRFLTKDRVDPPDVDSDFSYFGRDKLIRHLEEVHGKEAVCHIGTYTEMGVKSGLKDFARVLEIPFQDANLISKKIDEISLEVPGIKFKDLDKLKDEAEDLRVAGQIGPANEIEARYNEFVKLENQYKELFRLARKYEGTPRNMGSHASGILVMPCNVTDYFPTRVDKNGVRVALFTGPQLESLGAIKLDILGLKTLDVLDKTLKSIDKNLGVNDLYKEIEKNLDNEEMFALAQEKATEGLFQMESALFKMLCSDIIPTDEKDICAILAIGRPGPLSAGMHTQYAQRKNGFEDAIPQLRGTDKITEDTYHTIIYQEQCMLIAKLVAKFDDSQADSILRKALAKKKADKMELARRLFIYGKINEPAPADYDEENLNQPIYDPKGKYGSPVLGGINNGYTEEELTDFWNKLKGYASYLFNKSHSASYAVITLCTMYLKKFYTAKFFAALMSMQTTEEKIDLYSKTARKQYGIAILTPDVNLSDFDFKEIYGTILYGMNSIKGVGIPSIERILELRPFNDLQDAINKVEKKLLNKRVLNGLIKSGAFDFYNENRYELLNEMMDIRKEKDDRYIPISYDVETCMEMEKEVLGTSITHVPWWDEVNEDEPVQQWFTVENLGERKDKKGNMMAFITLVHQGIKINAIAFASVYCKNVTAFDKELTSKVLLKGKKDSKGKFIISSVIDTEGITSDISDLDMYI